MNILLLLLMIVLIRLVMMLFLRVLIIVVRDLVPHRLHQVMRILFIVRAVLAHVLLHMMIMLLRVAMMRCACSSAHALAWRCRGQLPHCAAHYLASCSAASSCVLCCRVSFSLVLRATHLVVMAIAIRQ